MLLERDELLEALRERHRAGRDGSGSMVLVGGEAGAGKSSLVSTFVSELDGSTLVLEGACDPLLTPSPLSPVRDFAADPAAGLSDVDVEHAENLAIFRRVLDVLAARDRPTVVVVEDVHWADQSTLDLLRFLGRRIGSTTTTVVATYRDDEVGPDHPLRSLLGQLATLPGTHRLSVPPLSEGAVVALAAGSSLDAVTLHDVTGGNPFFVTEALAGDEILPPTVQDAVLARVARLGPDARDAVRVVSLAPGSIDVAVAAELLGDRASAVDVAVDAGVLVADERTLRFRHELGRSVVEQSIAPATRQRLHRQMIDVLLDDRAPDHARLAHHAIRAVSPALIVEHAPEAAAEAARRGSVREVVVLLRAALEHQGFLEPEREGELLLDLAGHLLACDDGLAALDAARRAERIFADLGGPVDRRAMAIRHVSRALGRVGRAGEALAGSLEAVAMLEPSGDSEALAIALAGAASEFMLSRRVSEGVPLARRSLEMSERLELVPPQLSARHVLACLELVGGDPDRGIDLLERSVAEAGERWQEYSIAISNLGSGAGEVRRYDVARDALLRAETHGVEHDIDSTVDYVRAWLARISFEQGDWDEAVGYAEVVDRTAGNRSGYALLTADGALGRVRVRRGDPGGADLLAGRLDAASGHRLQYVWPLVAGLAEHHWLTGSVDRMADVLTGRYEAALATDSRWARGELAFWMWKAGRVDAAPPDAAEPYALQIDGRWREAADAWRAVGCPYERALALADGDPEARLEALAIVDGLGARPLADRLRAGLRDAGVERIPRGPNAATLAHPWNLTARQAEVLRLIGDGLSNGEIAERLFVSKKTVEHHVSAIYLKLGVDRRDRAAVAARELDRDRPGERSDQT